MIINNCNARATHGHYTFKPLAMKKLLSLTLLLPLVIIGCSNDDNEALNTPPVQEIAQGWLSYNEVFTNENIVITSSSQWEELLSEMEGVNEGITNTFTETDIDFDNYEVLASFQVKNGTTTVDITAVTENENNITVTVKNLQQGLTQDVALPFHIVKIQKSDKPVVFEQE